MDTTPSAKTRQVTLSLPPNFSSAAARRRRRARKRRATRLVTLFVAIVASLAIRRLCRSFEGDGELAAFLSEKIVGLACALLEVALLGPAGPFLARCWRALAAAIAALKLALPRVGNAAAAASASSVSESPGGALGVVDWRALSRDPRVFASVARTCVVAAHDALGAPLSFVVIVLLVTLWNGRRLSAIRARRCASNVSTRKIKARSIHWSPYDPVRRGERRSLRTFAGASLRPPLPFNPRPRRLSTPTDAFQLHPDIASYGTTLRPRGPGVSS